MRQNEIMKAIIRKVDEKGASNSLYAHCDQCGEGVCFISGQEWIQWSSKDGRKGIIDPAGC